MGTISKNARTGSTTQRFYCPEGGEIEMRTALINGKLVNVARCGKCGKELRRPSDFVDCMAGT